MKGMTNSIAPGNGAVPRAALAQDALYSPIRWLETTSNLQVADIGKTLIANNANAKLTVTGEVVSQLPTGTEIAVLSWAAAGPEIYFPDNITWSSGSGNNGKGKTYKIPEKATMIAIKKITGGGELLITGNVEVVS